jgi:hypothetical protein
MGRNRSRRMNARRILSNDHTSPLTTRSGKIIKPLRRKKKVTKKVTFRSDKKEESIGADTQQMTKGCTAIWEYFVPDKDSWSPYDQVVQSTLFQAIDMQINMIIEHDKYPHRYSKTYLNVWYI